jgi:alkylation response protein AidB-like acyl-CoA dehydrogenase
MDLRYTPEEQAFRREVRQFVETAIPAGVRRKVEEDRLLTKDEIVTCHRLLHAKGWAVANWPAEWGGRTWTPVQNLIFLDELEQSYVPLPLNFNVHMVGPVIAHFGSAAQKQRFLPPTANLDIWWCQGFSEPGAGSDLASLATSARREGDVYRVNGQKIWTTLAHWADWMFCLVRTGTAGKKQEGISFLLMDMKTPGITVRPIYTIDGRHEVNEVFLDDVRVPAENLVGEENKGWDYAKFLLTQERYGTTRIGASIGRVRRIKRLAAQRRIGSGVLLDDPRFQQKLAAVEIELKALEMVQLRAIAQDGTLPPGQPNPGSSILKMRGAQLYQATTELLIEVIGPSIIAARPSDGRIGDNVSPVAPSYAADAASSYFYNRAMSIYSGSDEIQRNIIAKRILGL